MRRKLFGRHGSITIFLCIILSAIILVESVYVASAYQRKREVLLTEAVSHQVEHALAQFDRNYLDWYGIYALTHVDGSSSVFDEMTKDLDGAQYTYELCHPFNDHDLRCSISEYMRLRGVAYAGDALLERLGVSISQIADNGNASGSGISKWLPTFQTFLKNKQVTKAVLEKVKSYASIVNLDKKIDDVNDFLDGAREAWEEKSSAVLEMGDSSVSISMFDPSSLTSLTDFFDSYMDADLPGWADRLIINEYAADQFDSAVAAYESDEGYEIESNMIGIPFAAMHGSNKADLEYLLVGSDHEWINTTMAKNFILGTRLMLNMGAFAMDKAKRNKAYGIAEVIVVMVAILSVGTIILDPSTVQYFILFVMAYIRAFSDMRKLVKGKSVPLFYNDTFQETMGEFAESKYRDYFRFALLLVPEDKLVSRMRTVIERDAVLPMYTGVRGVGALNGNGFAVERSYELYENH